MHESPCFARRWLIGHDRHDDLAQLIGKFGRPLVEVLPQPMTVSSVPGGLEGIVGRPRESNRAHPIHRLQHSMSATSGESRLGS